MMAYQPMQSKEGWFVIDDETGEPVNDEPLKSKSEALKLIRVMDVSKSMSPAMKAGPRPEMEMEMPMQAGMGAAPQMPNMMAGGAPSLDMMREMLQRKVGGNAKSSRSL